jgi:hypothetical protein
MIFTLLDLFLQKDSPYYKSNDNRVEMGNNMVLPKFAPLIATVATMVKRCFTPAWNEESISNNLIPLTYPGGKVTRSK